MWYIVVRFLRKPVLNQKESTDSTHGVGDGGDEGRMDVGGSLAIIEKTRLYFQKRDYIAVCK